MPTRASVQTVDELLSARRDDRADHAALVLGAQRLTYRELDRRASSVAAWLVEQGVRRGDRVGIHLHKGIEEVVATLAVARAGAVFVDVSYQWTAAQLDHVARDAELRVLFTDARKLRDVAVPERFERIVVVGDAAGDGRTVRWDSLEAEGADAFESPGSPGPDDLAALLYTSGSTGKPKGVMVAHRDVVAGARIVSGYLGITPDDRLLGLLPLSFDYGLNQLTSALLVGATLVLQPVVMPAEIVRTVAEHEVTGLALVPPSWVQLVRFLQESGARLPSLRYATNTGGKIPRSVLEAMPDVLPGVDVYLMYGLTEGFRSTYLPPGEFAAKMGSIGRAIPGVEIFVVHPERGICGPGEEGELVHRGALISRGYWRDPEATGRRIRPCPHLRDAIGDEEVLFSGDLVHRDEDGCLWFHGRMDDMIKCSGHRLSPTEVEEVLYASGQVGEALAFGVEDEELGQVVHAAVTASSGGALDPHALLRLCREELPSYMVPRRFHVWNGPFPRTASGKLDRPAVVRECAGPPDAPPGTHAWLSPATL